MAKSVSTHRPKTVDEAIILAEEIDFSIRTSQQDRLTSKPIHAQKQSQGQNQKLKGTKKQQNFEDRRLRKCIKPEFNMYGIQI